MKRTDAILWAVAGLVILTGAWFFWEDIVAILNPARLTARAALRSAARSVGLDPDILDAIGKVEGPEWRVDAYNGSGADGDRGGAWGLTQITEKTARAHGYTGPMVDLLTSPTLAAYWSALIMAARPGGVPLSIEDAAAWWNAGRASAALLPAGHKTLTDYIPKARAAFEYVRSHPVSEG